MKCDECGPNGCKGACPLPFDDRSIYLNVIQKPKPKGGYDERRTGT